MSEKGTPETAYELLALVAQHIEEEPRRYFQDAFALFGRSEIRDVAEMDAPPCGTTCCRAGWIVALGDGMPALRSLAAQSQLDIPSRARAILGMGDVGTFFDEFAAEADGDDGWNYDREVIPDDINKPGTPEYAQFGAAGVRAFMAKHEARLKARRLVDVPPVK